MAWEGLIWEENDKWGVSFLEAEPEEITEKGIFNNEARRFIK